jgi:hypothetical protein
MTLRADLAALLAGSGILDVDIEEAIEDEHVRTELYLKVIAVATASQHRDNDRIIVATILRDPIELVSKTVVVQLVDNIAMRTTDPAEFQQWAAGLIPKINLFKAEGSRRFLHRRICDWTIYLTINAGQIPTSAELTDATYWMQRIIAEKSTSLPILTVLAESGRTKKIRNIARNRAGTLMRKL